MSFSAAQLAWLFLFLWSVKCSSPLYQLFLPYSFRTRSGLDTDPFYKQAQANNSSLAWVSRLKGQACAKLGPAQSWAQPMDIQLNIRLLLFHFYCPTCIVSNIEVTLVYLSVRVHARGKFFLFFGTCSRCGGPLIDLTDIRVDPDWDKAIWFIKCFWYDLLFYWEMEILLYLTLLVELPNKA